MIGIADPKLWNLGVGLLSKWKGLTLSFFFLFISRQRWKNKIKYARPESAFFFVLRPVILPQPVWGRIAEKVQVLVA
jgi:hypothetical protein